LDVCQNGSSPRLNWDDYKRNIVAQLVDYMAKHSDQYQGELLKLVSEVVGDQIIPQAKPL